MSAAPCPGGCGCRWREDADARECGCDGGCCTEEWSATRPERPTEDAAAPADEPREEEPTSKYGPEVMSDDARGVFCEAAAEWDHDWQTGADGVEACAECETEAGR